MQSFNPMQYLAIDIANQYGLDKLNFNARIQWVKDNLNHLEAKTDEAEEPMLYAKAVHALRLSEQNKPTGHTVAFDSVCSGLQIMSALMRDKQGAYLTGLIDEDTRTDAYSLITDAMNDTLAAQGKQISIARQDAKKAVMTALYGSSQTPKAIFGEDTQTFWQVLQQKATGAYNLLKILIASWSAKKDAHSWTLPDDHFCYCPVLVKEEKRFKVDALNYTPTVYITKQAPQDFGLSNPANVIHSIDAYILRTVIRLCSYNKDACSRFLELSNQVCYRTPNHTINTRFSALNLVDITWIKHINKDNIRYINPIIINGLRQLCTQCLSHKPFDVITIHDSFAAHPNHIEHVRKHYNHTLARLSSSTLIDDILKQLGVQTKLQKGASISHYIKNSNYALC